jgi:hypothetical protein
MTAATRPTWRAALPNRTFMGHYAQMVVAMAIGMVVLGPLSMRVVHHSGAEGEMLLMATTMVVGAVTWMVCRRHTWSAIVEMAAVMYTSVAALVPFYWLGMLSPRALMILGHLVMSVGMAVAMLRRRRSPATRADHRCGTPSS